MTFLFLVQNLSLFFSFCFSVGFQNLMFIRKSKSPYVGRFYFLGAWGLFLIKKLTIFWGFFRKCRMAAQPPTCERASAPRPQTVGKSLFQFRNRAREKKTAAKPPAERSEAKKVPSEARLIKYISTYTCNTIEKTAAKPPTERSEANKVPSEARLIKYLQNEYNRHFLFLGLKAHTYMG